MQALFDADVIAYRWSWGDYKLSEVKDKARMFMDELYDTIEYDGLTVCISGPDNYRNLIDDFYKSQRPEKPDLYYPVKEWFLTEYSSYVRSFPHIEADDLVSIMQTANVRPTAIVSQDKDLLQIPGHHYRLFQKTGEGTWDTCVYHYQSPETAWRTYWAQCLSGDTGDNIQGCLGKGKIGSAKWAETLTYTGDTITDDVYAWDALVQEYVTAITKAKNSPTATTNHKWRVLASHYQTDDVEHVAYHEAYKTVLLVRMVRYGEYNFENQTLTLWEPPDA